MSAAQQPEEHDPDCRCALCEVPDLPWHSPAELRAAADREADRYHRQLDERAQRHG